MSGLSNFSAAEGDDCQLVGFDHFAVTCHGCFVWYDADDAPVNPQTAGAKESSAFCIASKRNSNRSRREYTGIQSFI